MHFLHNQTETEQNLPKPRIYRIFPTNTLSTEPLIPSLITRSKPF
uniref:Uncharacterized protein n=1 Tax=Rhizophora mucronata TaxID=61149 RepID=A0A2P2PFN0_RHIMU